MHHAAHAEALVLALADVLAKPPPDVFSTDVVAVHSRGLERWLAQRLSHHLGARPDAQDGICAGVAFPFPGTLISQALGDATGVTRAEDPWEVERSAWALLGLLERRPALADDTPLRRHLDGPDGTDGRFAAVRRVADLFDRYAVHRPMMLVRWATGDAADPVDAAGQPLPASTRWQAPLWRALRDDLDQPSPAERLRPAIDRLIADPDATSLPQRLALFGLTALPASYLEVLRAVAAHRAVHLLLSHPSPVLWKRTAAQLDKLTTPASRPADGRWALPPLRDQDPCSDTARNPLLRAWGRDAREMQVVLATTHAGDTSMTSADRDRHEPHRTPSRPVTLLERLQADVRGDVDPPGPPGADQFDQRPALLTDDRSVQIHACHGAERQVEVLRDVLLHQFAADPTLQPRDVLVLCPDIERFAPLIEAVFPTRAESVFDPAAAEDSASDDAGDPARPDRLGPSALRVRLSDRALKRTNPLLRVVAGLLELPDSRVSASQILDLAAATAVRTRFNFDDAELERIDTWVRELGIRWGFDRAHRDHHDVPTSLGTWRWGLDRLLVGAAVADEDERLVGSDDAVVPYDDVTAGDIDLAGRFAELLARIEAIAASLRDPRPIDAWRDAIQRAVALLTTTDDAPWQAAQLREVLEELVVAANGADPVALSLAEARTVLAERLEGAAGRANQRTGDLIVCSLVPMRSVPHRVVCLLGMDDGAFPRSVGVDGDNLLDLAPRVGDRDPRTEDRQLLLDALLAAEQQLVVTYRGHDERTNEPTPPAVPIGELLDVINRTVTASADVDATSAGAQITVHHPLHPFDPRNFEAGRLGVPGPLGSDRGDLAGARALTVVDRTEPGALLGSPLAPADEITVLTAAPDPIVELDALVRTLVNPIPTLLHTQLGLSFSDDDRTVRDELAVELDGLEKWAIGHPLLSAHLDGRDRARSLLLLAHRGLLPPGQLATTTEQEVSAAVEAIVALSAEHDAVGPADDVRELEVSLADGRRLVGAIDSLVGDVIRDIRYSRLRNAARLENWIRLVALTAAEPDRAWRAVAAGRARYEERKKAQASAAILAPLGTNTAARRERARQILDALVRIHDLANIRPIPVTIETSGTFAQTIWEIREGNRRLKRESRARTAWEGSPAFPGERSKPAYELVFGRDCSLHSLLEPRADAQESGEGWDEDEPSRFGRWALRLWAPLLAHEQLEDYA